MGTRFYCSNIGECFEKMSGLTRSYGNVSSIPTIAINVRKTLSPFVFYLCPAGKKAIIKGTAVCDNTGAAANVSLVAAGVSIAKWLAAGGQGNQNKPREMSVEVQFDFEIQLDAGDSISYSQDVGTNASIDFNAMVQETSL